MRSILLIIFFTLIKASFANAEDITCFTYELAQELNCSENYSEGSLEFCREKYGANYLSYNESVSCSQERADIEKGFINPSNLTVGIPEKLNQVSALLESFDRTKLSNLFPQQISREPILSQDSIDLAISIYKNLIEIKDELEKRSEFSVKDFKREKEVATFILLAISYHQLQSRYQQVEYHLRYDLSHDSAQVNRDKLDKLNLVLSEKFAKKVLEKAQLKSRHLENGRIEFQVSEQERMILEYLSLSSGKEKRDYAKLIGFLGLRDTLNNLWAIDRMSEQNLMITENSCGSFPSLSTESGLSNIPVLKENRAYDIYQNKIGSLLSKSSEIISEYTFFDRSIKLRLKDFSKRNNEFKNLVSSMAASESVSLDEHFSSIRDLILEMEEDENKRLIQEDLSTFVLPGDDILNFSCKGKLPKGV